MEVRDERCCDKKTCGAGSQRVWFSNRSQASLLHEAGGTLNVSEDMIMTCGICGKKSKGKVCASCKKIPF